jgi:hypothetical protein
MKIPSFLLPHLLPSCFNHEEEKRMIPSLLDLEKAEEMIMTMKREDEGVEESSFHCRTFP